MNRPSHTASPLARKRPSTESESRSSPSKKQKRHYHHIHRLDQPLSVQVPGAAFGDEPSVDQLLTSSIGMVLSETGFEYAEAVALDGMRRRTEEYLLHFLSSIRQSMQVCRRTQPIPQDFEHSFRAHDIAIDSLHPFLKPPHSVRKPAPLLPTPPPEEPHPRSCFPFLGDEVSGKEYQKVSTHIPGHFPRFPSRHTYQQTDVFTKREIDPRKVREQATEEGRLGEEALRKLTHAAKDSQALSRKHMKTKLWGRSHENMGTMFEKTLKAISGKSSPDATSGNANEVDASAELSFPFSGLPPPSPTATQKIPLETNGKSKPKIEMGPIVNCDRGNWRKNFLPDLRKAERQPQPSLGA